MTKEKPDLVYGTLDMLILKALQHDPRHGLGIADRIHQMSKDISLSQRVSQPLNPSTLNVFDLD